MGNTHVKNAQADVAEFFGFTPFVAIEIDGGKVFEIPNPVLLNDEQQERWDDLQIFLEGCDKDDSGELIQPYRLDGAPLKPTYNARLAAALLGDEAYAEFKAGGGSGNHVALEWARMNRQYVEGVDDASKTNVQVEIRPTDESVRRAATQFAADVRDGRLSVRQADE